MFLRTIALSTLLLCTALLAPAQDTPPPETEPVTIPALGQDVAPRTTRAARVESLAAERDKIVRARFDGPTNTDVWPGAFWSAYLVGLTDEQRGLLHEMTSKELVELSDKPVDFQRALLNAVYTLLPGQQRAPLVSALRGVETPREFAMAAYAILQASSLAHMRDMIRETMRDKFPDWDRDPILLVLHDRLEINPEDAIASRPPMVDLFAHPFKAGVPVLFSVHRLDRRQPGIALIRDAQGRFARTDTGTLFSVPHLAAAKTNLPGTITFGNSPRGIYTIRGMGRATNPFIGPTPYLWSKVPFEATVAEFLHDDTLEPNTPWALAQYLSLLPASWAGYFPMQEAFHAGRAGRSEMIIHGSTMDPAPFRAQPFYPLTPTAGCLSTIELWNPEDGRLLHSDQITLLRAFEAAGGPNGYLVVVELDNAARPVTILDVIEDVLEAEKRLAPVSESPS
jgi:hypothetical protein